MHRFFISIVFVFGSAVAIADGDAARGKSLTTMCLACHGEDGNSPAGDFPSIAGQNEDYSVKQMQDMKSGRREVLVMTGMLDDMSDQDLEDLAAYYASHAIKPGAASAEMVALGEQIYRAGIKRKDIAACSACHAPNGQGVAAAKFPALAGQWPKYTEAQLKLFRSGTRHNDGDGQMMRSTALDLSDEEIAAVASYIYGLR